MSLSSERIEPFEFPAMPFSPVDPSIQGLVEIQSCGDGAGNRRPHDSANSDDDLRIDSKLEEEIRRAFAAGRESGLAEGRRIESEAHAAALKVCDEQRAHQIAGLLNEIAQDRDRYLEAVEKEVVKLALAVAARILRREAQMDPLLLTGAVRVALGQLSATTEARLRVPPAELELWRDVVAHLPNLAIHPQVIAADGMLIGNCSIETSLGSVDLGVRSQLGEIERGFFDRAAKGGDASAQIKAASAESELMEA